MSRPELLTMRGVRKEFPGVVALDDVDFTLCAGEIHTLMGENGAGKSTLIRVMTGAYTADAGQIRLGDQIIAPRSPQEAQSVGISTVYQEVNLVPGMSIAENICVGRYPRKGPFIDRKRMRERAQAAVRRLGLDVDVDELLGGVSVAIQQMVAIARALDVDCKVLVLDEPTSSLDAAEVRALFQAMRRLRDDGLGIVFITHFLDQVFELSDEITVLRNGKKIGQWAATNLTRESLVGAMIGREWTSERERHDRRPATGEPIFSAKNISRKGALESASLSIRAGETVGLAGLLGSGRTETARIAFGADQIDGGEITPATKRSPRKSIAFGFAFCPEDRKIEGIAPDLSVRENIALVAQTKARWYRPISKVAQTKMANEFVAKLRIATSDLDKPVKQLSGGNQQKVILARWLVTNPRLLILDEPTRGVDVGAKAEILREVSRLRDEGMGVLLISSELEEVVASSDRVVVMRDRRSVAELTGDEISEEAIMQSIAGS